MRNGQLWRLAVVGAVIALLLHVHFVMQWESYLYSVPGYPEAFSKGRPPEAHLGSSPLSRQVAGILLFCVSVPIGITRSRAFWVSFWAFFSGLFTVELVAITFGTDFPGNLWPITLAGLVWYCGAPTLAGFFVGKLLRRVRFTL